MENVVFSFAALQPFRVPSYTPLLRCLPESPSPSPTPMHTIPNTRLHKRKQNHRRARNNSPEHSFPCVLSQEQATLVLRRRLADVFYPRHSSASEAGCHGHETLEERHGDDGDGGAKEQEVSGPARVDLSADAEVFTTAQRLFV